MTAKICSSCGNPQDAGHFVAESGRETHTCSACRRRQRHRNVSAVSDETYQLVAILGLMRSRVPPSRRIATRHVAQQLGIRPATVAAIWRGE